MHEADEKPVELLNTLIGVNNNRIECCRFANRQTRAAVLRVLFERLADTSLQCRDELIREVYKLGGVPHEGTLVTDTFLKVWLELETAVTKNDHLAILDSFTFEEGVVLKTYKEVLTKEEEHLNSLQQRLFQNQYEVISSDAGKLKNLKEIVINSVAPEPVKKPVREKAVHTMRKLARREFPQIVPAFISRTLFQ
jgi:uncharacterized protein (TIGR02284 family)